MILLGEVVDLGALWQAIWTAAVAGILVSVVFSLAVIGSIRSSDFRRTGQGALSALFALLAVVGVAGTAAVAVYGIYLITSK